MNALDLALDYISRGWNPVPVPFRGKKPLDDEWQKRIIDAAAAPAHFNGNPMNVGVQLGANSHNLNDVDLDCHEAIVMAAYILPPTKAIFGRASKRNSHRLYYSDLPTRIDKAVYQFHDPNTGEMLLELRIGGCGKGAQTVFPGSTHESGEPINWETDGEVAAVAGNDLYRLACELAAYCLIARYWPSAGSRHRGALVIGGFLARVGKTPVELKLIIDAIAHAVADEEWRDRLAAVKDAAEAYRAGKTAYGFPALAELIGRKVADKVAEWLDYQGEQHDEHEEEDAAGAKPITPLPFIDMSNWDNEDPPLREWAVYGRFPLRQVTLFSGEGAAGKSTVQLHECSAHALARDWLGTMPEPGAAIFIDAEDDADELHRRLAAICQHYGVTFRELIDGGLHLVSLAGDDAVLATTTKGGKIQPTQRYSQLLEAAGDLKPKMIGIASSANVFAGDENTRAEVQQFIGLLTKIAIVASGGLSLIAHPSLTGISTDTGLSGTTQWHNAVRARCYMKGIKPEAGEQPDSDLREIVFKKNNYGKLSESIMLRYQNGLYLPVPGMSNLSQAAKQANAEEVFLALLCRFTATNRIVCDKPSVSYAPAVFARESEAKKAALNSKALEGAMRELFRLGTIWNEPCGKPSRPSYRIALKP
jgi:RecA-family ATPase